MRSSAGGSGGQDSQLGRAFGAGHSNADHRLFPRRRAHTSVIGETWQSICQRLDQARSGVTVMMVPTGVRLIWLHGICIFNVCIIRMMIVRPDHRPAIAENQMVVMVCLRPGMLDLVSQLRRERSCINKRQRHAQHGAKAAYPKCSE